MGLKYIGSRVIAEIYRRFKNESIVGSKSYR